MRSGGTSWEHSPDMSLAYLFHINLDCSQRHQEKAAALSASK